MNRFAALTAVALVSGCASVSYMQSNYGDIKYVHFSNPALTEGYRVWDKPSANRMLLSWDRTAGIKKGWQKGIAYGMTDIRNPHGTWGQAAELYLASTGRTCKATGVKPILEPTNYEVTYRCG